MVMDQNPVMETLPAPDIVGREFVRQYYTLLNEAPEHAHRFYNSNSYFVHGPMSKPAIGQLEIHQKIQQLNFRDCHAKISQVDSQVTLGNGVVVQVSGELSNDGCPMRRFSQTFVLGTQSPKKYYVHNDIFRYQDTLHSDEEGDVSVEKDDQQIQQEQRDFYETVAPEENVAVLQPPQQAHQLPVAPVIPPHNHSVNGTGGIHHDEPVPAAVQAPIPVRVPEPVPVAEPHPPAPIANGGISMMANEDLARNLPPNNVTESASMSRTAPAHISADEASPPPNIDSSPIKDSYDQDSYQGQNNDSADTKPTYANLFRGNRNSRGPPPSRGIRSVVPPVSTPHPHSHSHHADPPPAASDQAPLPPPARSNYPDNQQVFMGNIPPEVTDVELREVFEVYGKVLEIKLFHNKKDGGCKSYGFVTFSESFEVSKVLKEKQVMLNKHPINVEEKKRQNKPQGGGGGHESGGWSSGRGQSGRGRAPRGGGASRGTPFTRGSAPPPSRPPYNAKR